ncbi:hypothetical protein OH799_34750 [Nocardia sp. NBC_00881]|uniref:hypothetical protein n=1 Tax=Nocardia sp. NBC_00881 TaxID=2975995 RepID=UPI00386BDBAF|nr:hypothetical protein OH799_34750 [Nocardia sp. NBC_00881]
MINGTWWRALLGDIGNAQSPADLEARHREAGLSGATTTRSKLAQDNPAWAVSSRESAVRAWRIHRDCDHTQCATLIAAIIVIRNDFEYLRDRKTMRERSRKSKR